MLILGTELYRETDFSDEAELEAVVERHSKLLFGTSTIFLSKKMLVRTGDERGTIPDAFVIDYENGDWYLVEVEVIGHGVWRHIVPQITNQIVACLNQETRNLLTDRVLEHIAQDQFLLSEHNIQQRVVSILRRDPIVAIPIDGTSRDLETWAQTQKLQISIWVVQKFESLSEPTRIAYQVPSNNEPSIVAQPTTAPIAMVRRAYTKNLGELIDAGAVADGETMVLTYRGRQFSGTARRDGIEVNGASHSPSEAAILCYTQAGSSRVTENGWRVWKNRAGQTLNELFDKVQADRESVTIPSA